MFHRFYCFGLLGNKFLHCGDGRVCLSKSFIDKCFGGDNFGCGSECLVVMSSWSSTAMALGTAIMLISVVTSVVSSVLTSVVATVRCTGWVVSCWRSRSMVAIVVPGRFSDGRSVGSVGITAIVTSIVEIILLTAIVVGIPIAFVFWKGFPTVWKGVSASNSVVIVSFR